MGAARGIRNAADAHDPFAVGRGEVLLKVRVPDVPAEAWPLLSHLGTAQSRRRGGRGHGGHARAQLRGAARHRFRCRGLIQGEKHERCHESCHEQAWRWGAIACLGHGLRWEASEKETGEVGGGGGVWPRRVTGDL
ncbi:Serine/threonine-protein phosphatase 2A 55 kDa regulatory subunit B [Psidium guajava]|nr:Serine/threonine-protein phosphatase 2A 55 kDa regulatory subunit B [Psidium guajava]